MGHLLKTRAARNDIRYNRFSDEVTGNGSYAIDVPNGGTTYVVGNLIEQGPNTKNPASLSYLTEGPNTLNPGQDLHVAFNTFVNDGRSGKFILTGSLLTTPVQILNNIFSGAGTITGQTTAVLEGNLAGLDFRFHNQSGYDYSLDTGSPAIAHAVPVDDPLAKPAEEYVHIACSQPRDNLLDVGGLEYRPVPNPVSCGFSDQISNPGLSLTVPSNVPAGDTITLNRVTLNQPAPPGGVTVRFSSSSSLLTVPSTVDIPGGSTYATFTMHTGTVSGSKTATLTAEWAGAATSANVIITQSKLKGITKQDDTHLLITLTAPAPSAGLVVKLTSAKATILYVPSSFTSPGGATSAAVTVTPKPVNVATSVLVTAASGGVTKTYTWRLYPTINRVSVSPISTTGGRSVTLTVVLHSPAPAGGAVVALSASPQLVSVPDTLTVPAGSTTGKTTAATNVVTATKTVTLTAVYNGNSQTAKLTLKPVALSKLNCAPSIRSGKTVASNSVRLNGPAGSDGLVVTLRSSDPVLDVPATVVVPEGSLVAKFPIAADEITDSTPVVVTASYNGINQTDTVEVLP